MANFPAGPAGSPDPNEGLKSAQNWYDPGHGNPGEPDNSQHNAQYISPFDTKNALRQTYLDAADFIHLGDGTIGKKDWLYKPNTNPGPGDPPLPKYLDTSQPFKDMLTAPRNYWLGTADPWPAPWPVALPPGQTAPYEPPGWVAFAQVGGGADNVYWGWGADGTTDAYAAGGVRAGKVPAYQEARVWGTGTAAVIQIYTVSGGAYDPTKWQTVANIKLGDEYIDMTPPQTIYQLAP